MANCAYLPYYNPAPTVFPVFLSVPNTGSTTQMATTINNGLSWTEQAAPTSLTTQYYWSLAAWNGSFFCVLLSDNDGNTLSAISVDGLTNWTISNPLPNTASPRAFVWTGTVFCFITDVGEGSFTSTDGLNWFGPHSM